MLSLSDLNKEKISEKRIGLQATQELELKNFEIQKMEFTDGRNTIPYCFVRPKNIDNTISLAKPLIVFLHGAGERGNDGIKQLAKTAGAYELLQTLDSMNQECFMIIPQCPENALWSGIKSQHLPYIKQEEPTIQMKLVIKLTNDICEKSPIDKSRIYAIGLSAGSMGMWDMISRIPEKFAAGISVCAGFDPRIAPALKGISLRVFHGDKDPKVPIEGTRELVKSLIVNKVDVEYVEYPGANHHVWVQTFMNKDNIEWLFKKNK